VSILRFLRPADSWGGDSCGRVRRKSNRSTGCVPRAGKPAWKLSKELACGEPLASRGGGCRLHCVQESTEAKRRALPAEPPAFTKPLCCFFWPAAAGASPPSASKESTKSEYARAAASSSCLARSSRASFSRWYLVFARGPVSLLCASLEPCASERQPGSFTMDQRPWAQFGSCAAADWDPWPALRIQVGRWVVERLWFLDL
jgi:hypothetical protein